MRIVRLKGALTLGEIVLSISLILTMSLLCVIAYNYYHLHSSDPMENFRAEIRPSENGSILKAYGSYDRAIVCELYDFDLYLVDTDNGKEYIVTPSEAVQIPKRNATPGDNKEIEFAVRTPKNMSSGWYTPRMHANYICSYSIFETKKSVVLTATAFKYP